MTEHEPNCPRRVNVEATCSCGYRPPTPELKVYSLELAVGVAPLLLAFLEWWIAWGPHAIVVAGPERLWPWVPPGGVREGPAAAKAQAKAFDLKLSFARTLQETPHYPRVIPGVGRRGCAIDCWPIEFDPNVPWDKQPEVVKEKFRVYGELGEKRGLEWGGRWKGKFGKGAGDQPHLQLPDWKALRLA